MGAAWDPAIFGETADTFLPSRYCNRTRKIIVDEDLTFGAGAKSCLRWQKMREVTMTLTKIWLGSTGKDNCPKRSLGVNVSGDIHRILIDVYRTGLAGKQKSSQINGLRTWNTDRHKDRWNLWWWKLYTILVRQSELRLCWILEFWQLTSTIYTRSWL